MLKSLIISLCLFSSSLTAISQDKDPAIYGKWKLEASSIDSLLRELAKQTATSRITEATVYSDTSTMGFSADTLIIADTTYYSKPDHKQRTITSVKTFPADTGRVEFNESAMNPVLEVLKQMEFTFLPDGTFEVRIPNSPVNTGKYSLNKRTSTIIMEGKNFGEKKNEGQFRIFQDKLELVFQDPVNEKFRVWMLFKRVQ